MRLKYFLLLSIAFFISLSLNAEDKKALTFEEMTSWESINSRQISNNGNFVVYETAPLRGDYKTIITNTLQSSVDTLNFAKSSQISASEDFLVARLQHPYDSLRQMKIDKVPAKKMPKDSVIIYDLAKADILYTFPKVKNYKVTAHEGNYAAILLDKKALNKKKEEEKKDTSAVDSALVADIDTAQLAELVPDSTFAQAQEILPDSTKTEVKKKKKKKTPKKLGDILITYNGATSDTTLYESVTEYTIAKNGTSMAFIQAFEDSLKYSEVFFLYTTDDVAISVFRIAGEVKKLTLSEDGEQLAFLYSKDTTDVKRFNVAWSTGLNAAKHLIDSATVGMPEDWNISENGTLRFNKEGSRLYMGTNKIARPEPKDTVPKDEIPGVDVWSWSDLRLQPQQLLEANKDKKKSYLAIYDFEEEKFTQLANKTYDKASLDREGKNNYALLSNGKPYLRASNWTGRWAVDAAIKNLETGDITEVAQDILSPRMSAAGHFVYWFNDMDTSYYCYSIEDETTVCLNKDIAYPIYDETNDRPMVPSAYGVMGWAKNDKYIYIYDRYDIWQVDPKGKKSSVCITNGFGRKNNTRLRYECLDNELTYIPQEIYLLGENIENNANYYFKASLKKATTPTQLYGGNFALYSLMKAKNTDKVLWGKMTVKDYPNIQFSSLDFSNAVQISKMNPQQENYNWATVEPVSWTSFKGEKLNGLIYKPENFNPQKKYPVMFYFYERSFDTQHRYFTPSPSRSIINRTFYASNGYIVFVPDITYTNGYPGQSAYDAIVSGAQSLIERFEWVDKERMALSGQSWGGYQTAYLITQTDLFAAAMGGAVVSNMTSAYGGIRWGSGLNRQFQYEKTQSRIGGTLWEKPMLYIENSPLFYAPKVNTPLLLMHNDKDTAVPWYQGIEYFTALRRLNKPVWMLNYNNEPHNLKAESIANRLDLSKRMKQFFDYYLLDTPAPEWMTKGVPAVEKGKNLGY